MFKKLFSFLIVLSMTLVLFTGVPISVSAEENADNKCGDNLTWTLDDSGLLTISGTGNMNYWDRNTKVPWDSNRGDINNVVISEGVTSIGNYAFWNCSNLTSVTIPNGVTSIGGSAFWNCSNLTSIEIPNSVTSIDSNAFYGCSNLTSIEIPNSVTSISFYAFSSCTSLTSVIIPDSVKKIGIYAFYNCSDLKTVFYPDTCTNVADNAFGGTTNATLIKYNVNGGKLTITDIIPSGDETSVNIGTMDGDYSSMTADTIIYKSGLTVSGDIVSPTTTKIEYTEEDGKITISKIEVPNGGKAEIPATIGGKPVVAVAEEYRGNVDTTNHTTHTYGADDKCTICNAAKPAETTPTVTTAPDDDTSTTTETTTDEGGSQTSPAGTTASTGTTGSSSAWWEPAPVFTTASAVTTTVTTTVTAAPEEIIYGDETDETGEDISAGAGVYEENRDIPGSLIAFAFIALLAGSAVLIKKLVS